MTSNISSRRPLLRATLTASLALLFLLVLNSVPGGSPPQTVQAHEDGTEIFSAVDGPFVIGVRILPLQPVVGQIHVTITVELLETGEPVEDARIRITARHSQGEGEAQFSPGLNIPTQRRFYDANFQLDTGGAWDFEVEVESDAGEGTVETPILIARRVRGDGLGIPGTMMFILVTVALFGGGGWITFTARKKQRIRRDRVERGRRERAERA